MKKNYEFDQRLMGLAIRMGDRQRGRTGANPAVGCVLAREGKALGAGATGDGGRPHAEANAIETARHLGHDLAGADAYVSLEPCAHKGKTGPCTEALIQAGVARVICPWCDPDKRVSGQGFAKLRAAGIKVEHPYHVHPPDGLLPYLFAKTKKRPFVTLKLATSLDGKIALSNGESRWITGAPARRFAHMLRAQNSAVAVGIGTMLADNPRLDVRVPGAFAQPVPVIFDTHLRTPLDAQIFDWARPIIFHGLQDIGSEIAQHQLLSQRAELVQIAPVIKPRSPAKAPTKGAAPKPDEGAQLSFALHELAKKGLTSLLVEGGAGLAAGFLRAGLVDRLVLMSAGAIIGGDGIGAIGDLGHEDMEGIARMKCAHHFCIGEDYVRIFDAQSNFDALRPD